MFFVVSLMLADMFRVPMGLPFWLEWLGQAFGLGVVFYGFRDSAKYAHVMARSSLLDNNPNIHRSL